MIFRQLINFKMITDKFLIIFFIIIIYAIIIFIMKHLGIGKKEKCDTCNNCCPDCKSALNRIQRKKIDHIIHHISFRAFDSRRYLCTDCGWEGLRWEEKFKGRN